MDFKEFLMEDFGEVEVIEKEMEIGGKKRKMRFKPIPSTIGDEIRNKSRVTKIHKGRKVIETNDKKYLANLIIETTVHPDFKNAEFQSAWGVVGAEELVYAMKAKMTDGEYAQLTSTVSEINGYDKGMEEEIEEAKN